jgi:hypothetical protein
LFNSVHTHLNSISGTESVESIKGVLLVCQAALLNIKPLSHLSKIFGGISTLMCKLAEHYIQILSGELTVIAVTPAE